MAKGLVEPIEGQEAQNDQTWTKPTVATSANCHGSAEQVSHTGSMQNSNGLLMADNPLVVMTVGQEHSIRSGKLISWPDTDNTAV